MKSLFTAAATLAFVVLLVTGCKSPRRGEPITGLVPASDPQLAEGRRVFFENCHQCHPGGEGGLGPALNDKPAPRFLMKTQVRVGLGVMPKFTEEQISSEELDQLMDYLMALRHNEGK